MIRSSLVSSTRDLEAPFFDDSHRSLARFLDEKNDLASDEAIRDVARVGARLGEIGLYRHFTIPPNVRALCAIREILAYHSPLADGVFAVQGLSSYCLATSGRTELVEEMLRGEKIGAFALTEPEAGSDVASLRATARRDGDHWVLDGEKTYISNVGIAHHYVVFANADPSQGKKGISAFLVPASTSGIELARIELSGHHPLGRILMHGCRVPASALLGEIGHGLRLAFGTLEVFRTSVGAAACGMAWRAIDEALAHTTRRAQFGQKLAEFQLVQAAIAEMVTELHAARLVVASVAHAKDAANKKDVGADVAMAKMHATEAAARIIDRAVQLHGALGVVHGQRVEELYREVRPLRIYEGASDILKLIVGGAYIKRHAEATP